MSRQRCHCHIGCNGSGWDWKDIGPLPGHTPRNAATVYCACPAGDELRAKEQAKREAQPTVHVTNWASRKLHRGRVFTIMAKPRSWEHGAGTIRELVPKAQDLAEVRAETIDMETYRARFVAGVSLEALRPPHPLLGDGNTVCCACSREAAARGECHRVWSAQLLLEAGWNVVLDGKSLEVRDGR